MTTRARGEWTFTGPTAPFFDSDGSDPARFVLAQVADNRFTLEAGLRYDDGDIRVEVDPDSLIDTDLASIPLFMAWFVPVNGRHTPAALVHDKLVADTRDLPRDTALQRRRAATRRADADDVFSDAMAASGVPALRRGLMHAAVTLATRWSATAQARIAVVMWVLASLVGTTTLVWSVFSGDWVVALGAILAPTIFGLLWGRRSWAPAVLAGYAVWVIGLPALGTAVGYSLYWAAEQLLRLVSAGGSIGSAAEKPRPVRYR